MKGRLKTAQSKCDEFWDRLPSKTQEAPANEEDPDRRRSYRRLTPLVSPHLSAKTIRGLSERAVVVATTY